jgi:hypothetical protein
MNFRLVSKLIYSHRQEVTLQKLCCCYNLNARTPGIFAREIAHLKCDKFFLNRAIILGAW